MLLFNRLKEFDLVLLIDLIKDINRYNELKEIDCDHISETFNKEGSRSQGRREQEEDELISMDGVSFKPKLQEKIMNFS